MDWSYIILFTLLISATSVQNTLEHLIIHIAFLFLFDDCVFAVLLCFNDTVFLLTTFYSLVLMDTDCLCPKVNTFVSFSSALMLMLWVCQRGVAVPWDSLSAISAFLLVTLLITLQQQYLAHSCANAKHCDDWDDRASRFRPHRCPAVLSPNSGQVAST